MLNLYNVIKVFFILFNINNTYAFNFYPSRRTIITNGLLMANTNYYNKNTLLLSQENNQNTNNISNNNIYFNGPITDETCMQLKYALDKHRYFYFNNDNYPKAINLFIQSPGGSLLPTLALVDEIKNFDVDIHTFIRGYAASAATLLSVIGKKRYIYKNSLMMIHGIKLNEQTVSNVLQVKDLNHNIDLFMSIITDIYLENSNIDKKMLFELFEHDIWLDSKNALKFGFVDKIL